MAITLTESAARQIKDQLVRRGKGLGMRVGTCGCGESFSVKEVAKPQSQ